MAEDPLPRPSLILGLDTATDACSAALYDPEGARACATLSVPMRKGHAEALLPLVERALKEAGATYADVDRVAVTVGPGTFTGTRVGLAAARGIALAASCPAVGVTVLEALAFELDAHISSVEGIRIAVQDARRGQLYAQAFAQGGGPLSDPAALDVDRAAGDFAALAEGGPVFAAGTGAEILSKALAGVGISCQAISVRIDGVSVARLGAGRDVHPGTRPAPLYLRPPDAALPKSRP